MSELSSRLVHLESIIRYMRACKIKLSAHANSSAPSETFVRRKYIDTIQREIPYPEKANKAEMPWYWKEYEKLQDDSLPLLAPEAIAVDKRLLRTGFDMIRAVYVAIGEELDEIEAVLKAESVSNEGALGRAKEMRRLVGGRSGLGASHR